MLSPARHLIKGSGGWASSHLSTRGNGCAGQGHQVVLRIGSGALRQGISQGDCAGLGEERDLHTKAIMAAEGSRGSGGGGDEKGNTLWNLLPSFDPSVDDAKEYSDKVLFLHGICPRNQRPMLAPRLAMLCKGTAWSQVRAISSEKLTDGEEGVKHLLEALSTWQETSEMQTYERFERLIYKTLQKSDESTMSYTNRMSVAFQEVGDAVTIGEVKAFLLLRQSALDGEDKRKIISMTNGALDYHKIDMAMRALSSKVLSDGHGSSRKKVYPVNFVEEESSEHPEDALMTSADEYLDEETALQWLLHEGDEQAMLVQEFEDQVVDVVQESPELAMAFSAYQDARARIRDRIRSRGFWPTKGGSKGKWSSSSTWSSSGSKGKGKSMGKRSTLAERIAMSHCRLCGQKGHWKRECPRRDTSSTNDTNLAYIDEETDMDDAFVDRLPPLRSLEARNCTEDFVFVACHFWSKSSHEGEGQKNRHLRSHLGEFREHFQVVLASMADSDVRTVSRHGVVGIIDTGASKSVVGQNRVQALVDSLPEACRNRVARRPSDTVFRFGNNGTLRSIEALYLPFGARWMKVEVVAGSTPFLVSNAFLFALEAILDIARSELVIPSWSKSFRLTRNEKGLMTVNLVEMIAVAEAKDSDRRPTHEVISFASSQGEPHEKGLPDMIETHETSRSQNTEQTHTAAAKVAQTTPIARPSSTLLELSSPYHGRVQRVQGEDHGHRSKSPGRTESSNATVGCTLGRGRGPRDGRPEDQEPRGTARTSARHQLSSGVGRDCVSGGQACAEDIPVGLRARSAVHQFYDQEHEAQDGLDQELSRLLQASDGHCQQAQLSGPSEAARGNPQGQVTDGRGWRPSLEGARDGRKGEHRLGTSLSQAGGQPVFECIQATPGIRDEDGDRSDVGHEGGSSRQDCHPSEGDREAHEAVRDVDFSSEAQTLAPGEMQYDLSLLCEDIDKQIEFLESEFAYILETRREVREGKQEKWGLDLLEVYCSETSEITRQSQRFGLRVERFTVHHGDLSSEEGQQRLWSLIHRARPREIWVAPECGPWGNFSRLNMSKSSKTADTIQAKRKHERKHLRLCNELFLHQMVVGGHFHMEQPLGSELIHQPEVRDIRLGTLCTTFDMCEVGKLLAPAATKQRRGNNFLRKRTTVYTTSPLFHRSFDHRYCQRRHDHTRIEGQVFHLGKWISLSEYAARYSSGFGRNVARYLAVEVANPSLWWDELQNSGCDVDPAFVGEVMRRRARPGTDAGELNGDASKRRRVHFKQPAQDSQGHAGNEFWVDVFQRIEPEVPTVGKRCFINDEILARVQEGVPGIKIRRIEACRGTERYRLPDSAVDHASVPLRLTSSEEA